MKYKINNIRLYGYHGNTEHEKNNAQFYKISLAYTSNHLINSDDLKDVLDYTLIFDTVKNTFFNKRYNLIESLAHDIYIELKKTYPIKNLKVTIAKKNPFKNNKIESIIFEYK